MGRLNADSIEFKSPPDRANGFTSTEVQAAIEEALALAKLVSRGAVMCGFDGSAGVGRWLEFFTNNPSNLNPLIIPEPSELISLSLSASTNSTGTVTLFNNGVESTTISLSGNRKARVKGLSIAYIDLDEISLKVTSGTINRPTLAICIRTV